MVGPFKTLLSILFHLCSLNSPQAQKHKDQQSSGGGWCFGKEERREAGHLACLRAVLLQELRKAISFSPSSGAGKPGT